MSERNPISILHDFLAKSGRKATFEFSSHLTGFRCTVKLEDVVLGAAESKKKQLAKRQASVEALKILNRAERKGDTIALTDEIAVEPAASRALPQEPGAPVKKKTQTGPWLADFDSRELLQTETVTQHCNLLLEVMLLKLKPSQDKVMSAQRLLEEFEESKALLSHIKVSTTFFTGSFPTGCIRDDNYDVDVLGICKDG